LKTVKRRRRRRVPNISQIYTLTHRVHNLKSLLQVTPTSMIMLTLQSLMAERGKQRVSRQGWDVDGQRRCGGGVVVGEVGCGSRERGN
jgi:hypothetical protein